MAKYTVNCNSCGESMEVALFGRTRDREWKLENYTWTCKSCQAKERAESGKQAAKENAELGLPPLEGTEKQIAWAERIRKSIIDDNIVERVISYVSVEISKTEAEKLSSENSIKDKEGLTQFFDKKVSEELSVISSASWWIDNRDNVSSAIARDILNGLRKESSPDQMPEAEGAKQESIIAPACELITQAIAEISVFENRVEINLPEKVEEFRQMVRAVGFSWTGDRWQRYGDGLNKQSAAYVGQQTLAMGIRIIVLNEEIAETIKGGLAKACWITSSDTHVFLQWWSGDWYKRCKSLPGARWSKPFVKVELKYRDEILDFAEREDFGVTEPTMKRLSSPVKKEIVAVSPVENNPAERPDLKPEAFDVAESLKDDVLKISDLSPEKWYLATPQGSNPCDRHPIKFKGACRYIGEMQKHENDPFDHFEDGSCNSWPFDWGRLNETDSGLYGYNDNCDTPYLIQEVQDV